MTKQILDSTTQRLSDPGTHKTVSPIRLRAILLGLLLIPVNCYWVIITEIRWYSLDGTCLPLFIQPTFMLFCLALLNLVARRYAPRLALRPAELIIIYIMVAVSSTMAGHDTIQNLFGSITYPLWYPQIITNSNWPQLFFPYLPKWLLVWDVPALRAFNNGNASWLNYLYAWTTPLFAWGIFILFMLLVLFSLNVLIRKPWTDHEKLTFPIVQLPLAITQQSNFFSNRLLWVGFAIAFGLRLFAGMHRLFPDLPYLKLNNGETWLSFDNPPWNAMGAIPMSFYPFMIGIVYFIPLDLSFSCWFFFIFRYIEVLFAAASGWSLPGPADPYRYEQATGAWLGMGIVLFWSLRRHFLAALKSVIRRNKSLDENEPVSYRWAVIGFFVGLLGMGAFCVLAGMSFLLAVGFLIMWLLVSLTIARVRAELGAPHEVFTNPSNHMVTIFGTSLLGPRDFTGLAMMYWFNRCYRNHPMPNQLEAMRMSEATGTLRRLGWILLVASIFSIIFVYWSHLYVGYRDGVSAKATGFKSWVGAEAFSTLASRIQIGEPVETQRRIAMLAGLVVVFALRTLRERWISWPFHPAGYALGMSYALDYFWMPFFIGWLIKLLLSRYGGITVQRRAVPFFLGLILGDYTMGCLWAIYGPAAGIMTYKIFIR
jgi:hypothetical protein